MPDAALSPAPEPTRPARPMPGARATRVAALLAGGLGAFGFAPFGQTWLLVATLVALCALAMPGLAGRGRVRAAALIGWCYGFGQFVVGLNWIATAFTYQSAMPAWLGWIGVAGLSAYLALFPAMAVGGAAAVARLADGRWRARALVLMLGATWIVAEWLRSIVLTGFPWNPLSASVVDWAVPARLWGSYGVSGLVVLTGGAVFLALRRDAAGAGIVAALVLAASLPALMFDVRAATDQPMPLATVVQPLVPQDMKHDPALDARNFAAHVAQSGRPTGASGPRLLLWPEVAIPDFIEDGYPLRYYRRDPAGVRDALGRLIGPDDRLLIGIVRLRPDGRGDIAGAHNSVAEIRPGGAIGQTYDKAHLVPFGEYLPWRPLLSRIGLSRLVPGAMDFVPGPGPATMDLGPFGRVGVQICYEIIFSGRVVDRGDPPQMLFNPSNDAWFGAWGPPQHLAQARLRAIEEGVAVLRATPTGISAIIDGRDGRLLGQVAAGRAGAVTLRVPDRMMPTPFARLGNVLPLALAAMLLIVALMVARPHRGDYRIRTEDSVARTAA